MTKLVNRAKMTTATTGTGTITLGSAVDGYQTFAAAGVADADVVRYVIEDGDAWEIGTGTYTASGTTLSRTVVESSNADAAINLSGTATVFITAAAADILQPGDNVSELTNDAGYTTNTGTVTSVDLTAGTGISVSGGPVTSSGSITVTNTAPDQTVVLTAGTGISTSGTYPNFTVTNTAPDQTVTLTGGGATSISGTYPNFTISSTDTNTTYSAGNGITLTGTTFSVAAGGGLTQDAGGLSHSDTSAQASVDNSNGVVIQDVTLDTYGHVTGLASVDLDTRYYTETEIDTKLTNGTVSKINNNWSNLTGNLSGYVNDGGGNLGFRFNATPGATNTLVENGIAYELDVSNDSTTGDLVIFRGSTASGTAGETITFTEAFAIDGGTNVLRGFGQTIWTAGNDGAGSGLDADLLDGQQGSYYLDYNNFTNTPAAPTITLSGDLSGSGTTSINAQVVANAIGANELNVSGNGTSGQVLSSDGDGSFSWSDAGGGASEMLSSVDISSAASVAFSLPSGYDYFTVALGNVIPATDGSFLKLLASSNGGSSYITSYRFQLDSNGFDTNSILVGGFFGLGNATDEDGVSGTIKVLFPSLAKRTRLLQSTFSRFPDGTAEYLDNAAEVLDSSATNNIKFEMSSGNISSGTITLYGHKS